MTRPNIILIISDQLRRQALGCYGDPNVSTPNIDALAASGARFTQTSSTYPVCVPFRFTLMTGEYAHTRFIPAIEWRMSPAERTLADEFNDAGYDTGMFGKWHLYGNFGHYPGHNVVKASRTPVPRPFQGRFGTFAGFDIANDPYDTWYSTHDDPTMRKLDGYQTDELFGMAARYATQERDKPFAAVLSVEPPHPLFTAPPEYLERWRDRPLVLRENVELDKEYRKRGPHGRDLLDDLRVYYAMIENLDDNVGRLVAALRDAGTLDDTIIALTADHGELLGCHGLLAKQRPWEESLGTPLIVGNVGPGSRVVDEPTCTEDLFPTLLGLAGITPRDPKPGRNLAPIARGEADRLDREGVLLEFVGELRPNIVYHDETWRGVRTRRYKYTVLGDAHGGKPWQFFDLETDPYELTNLVDDPKYADEVRHHHELLRERMAETYDHYVLAPAFGVPGLNLWDPEAEHQLRFG
ncbi:sulfatase family protein [Rugosimonospora africana]|uniref:Arylsulfatase n=1 Tax=Rugosimonospora africana TaxID=556532 RepID=A0A8J3VQ27_9ACTN|nr:sulfatase [Rugosimonospora africana]GIH14036.1 arylsulfatase [Rugosimonospora africana]